MMDNLKIRIFGSKECEKCEALIKAFQYHAIHFEFVDANDPANEELCDKYHVDELPHIQGIYSDNNKAFLNHVGYVSPIEFLEKIRSKSKILEEFFNINKEIASKNVDMEAIKKEQNERKSQPRGCSACAKKNNSQPGTGTGG